MFEIGEEVCFKGYRTRLGSFYLPSEHLGKTFLFDGPDYPFHKLVPVSATGFKEHRILVYLDEIEKIRKDYTIEGFL